MDLKDISLHERVTRATARAVAEGFPKAKRRSENQRSNKASLPTAAYQSTLTDSWKVPRRFHGERGEKSPRRGDRL